VTRLRVAALVVAATAGLVSPPTVGARRPIPLFAYYYIWFNATSWQRAKLDYPLLGRYSSDETRTMRQHVRWAKEAGIDGFIVSWKSTPVLNRRLAKLVAVADAERFKLAIIYQGLDFHRQPLPAQRVGDDLVFFEKRFARDRAFRIFSKPLVIWSGTWNFSVTDVRRVTRRVRPALLVLASQRQRDDYLALAGAVDGNAYYWASVDPRRTPGYAEKLQEMGAAVHAHGGLWIAPAAPGFDARALGGASVVERRDGATLRDEMATALRSSPDAIGVISWNEFSENTHIEPSKRYGGKYLGVLAELQHAHAPRLVDFDSDESATTGFGYALWFVVGAAAFIVLGGGVAVRRHVKRGQTAG
jgi:hypothetical protein